MLLLVLPWPWPAIAAQKERAGCGGGEATGGGHGFHSTTAAAAAHHSAPPGAHPPPGGYEVISAPFVGDDGDRPGGCSHMLRRQGFCPAWPGPKKKGAPPVSISLPGPPAALDCVTAQREVPWPRATVARSAPEPAAYQLREGLALAALLTPHAARAPSLTLTHSPPSVFFTHCFRYMTPGYWADVSSYPSAHPPVPPSWHLLSSVTHQCTTYHVPRPYLLVGAGMPFRCSAVVNT